MRRNKNQGEEKLRNKIDEAIKEIKTYGIQDKYVGTIEGNHYGFIAVVDALTILEKAMRAE